MSTLILHHDDCLAHDPGKMHPESIQRLRTVLEALEQLPGTEKLPAPRASLEQITRAHDLDYWQSLLDAEPREGRAMLDEDTFLSPGSINATLRASGAACFAV
ncbi:MAG TPA: histone deacetylase family protein, partial [Xanthomonadales bacterium]|nr:histone deacetylase family protein [Xanthomonadales bacterium]